MQVNYTPFYPFTIVIHFYCKAKLNLLSGYPFFRLEITSMLHEKEAFKEKISQMENKILVDQAQIRDLESKIKIIDGERLSIIASKTNLQHKFTELQVN